MTDLKQLMEDYIEGKISDLELETEMAARAKAEGTRLPSNTETVRGFTKALNALGLDLEEISIVTTLAGRFTRQVMDENDSEPGNGDLEVLSPDQERQDEFNEIDSTGGLHG